MQNIKNVIHPILINIQSFQNERINSQILIVITHLYLLLLFSENKISFLYILFVFILYYKLCMIRMIANHAH
jgi:hypothetical protein